MRSKKKQILRLKKVLEVDRNEEKDDFISLLEKDLTSVFNEYFEFETNPICKLNRQDGNIEIVVSLQAKNIKAFGVLP